MRQVLKPHLLFFCKYPSVVSRLSGIAGYNECNIGWSNGVCHDEMLVVAGIGTSISFTPTGNGSAYTANAAFGSGTNVGTSQFIVFKGTGTTETVTALTMAILIVFLFINVRVLHGVRQHQ